MSFFLHNLCTLLDTYLYTVSLFLHVLLFNGGITFRIVLSKIKFYISMPMIGNSWMCTQWSTTVQFYLQYISQAYANVTPTKLHYMYNYLHIAYKIVTIRLQRALVAMVTCFGCDNKHHLASCVNSTYYSILSVFLYWIVWRLDLKPLVFALHTANVLTKVRCPN